ncbi:MAG: hypothetical protein K2O20_05375 [Duncaniella sp.]|nr:hypothetical protein [Duncaniella sp.]
MKKDNRSNILLRYGLVIVFILLLSATIVSKLIENTVIDADKWNERANAMLTQSKVIVPPRGNILASDGSVLATNLNFYTARIYYRAEKFNEKLLRDTIDWLAADMARLFPVRDAKAWKNTSSRPSTRSTANAPEPTSSSAASRTPTWRPCAPFHSSASKTATATA